MIKKLHKRESHNRQFEPNEGERTLLCSNNGDGRSPSLGSEKQFSEEEEEQLRALAEIIVEAILWQINHEE